MPGIKAGAAWAVGLGFALPMISTKPHPDTCELELADAPWLTIYLPLVCFFIPLAIIASLYLVIFVVMVRKMRRKRAQEALTSALRSTTTTLMATSTNLTTTTTLVSGLT